MIVYDTIEVFVCSFNT